MTTKAIAFSVLLSISASGCAIGPCMTWEVGGKYQDSNIYGMYICKNIIENYSRYNKQGIYTKARQLLESASEKYSECSIIEDSLVIYNRTDQVFLKIDCEKLER